MTNASRNYIIDLRGHRIAGLCQSIGRAEDRIAGTKRIMRYCDAGAKPLPTGRFGGMSPESPNAATNCHWPKRR